MIILGMTGPIDHGKTTFADAVANLEPTAKQFESGMLISEVANAWQATLTAPIDPTDVDAINNWLRNLPGILLHVVHAACRFEDVTLDANEIALHPVEYQKLLLHLQNVKHDFSLAQQQITAANKETYRPLLQWLGGYLVQSVDPGIWWNEMVLRIQAAGEEGCQLAIAAALRFPGDAAVMRQAGAKIVKVYRPGHLQNDVLDPTERERESIVPDCTIVNDGSLDGVKATAEQFYRDLIAGTLQPTYNASHYAQQAGM
jgi:hypothetical protein